MSSSPTTEASGREQWGSQLGFLLAAIGSAIGLGNIWRFPGEAYSNGGGAFMIPYIVALLTAGIPVLFLDYALGHRYRGSTPAVFRRLSRKLEWLGWWQVFICFIIMTYYAVIIAWSLRYVFYSANVAWKGRKTETFFNEFIRASDPGSFSIVPVMNVFVPLAVVWIVVLVVIGRGVSRGVELANRIFLPLLVILFVALVVRALLLPGAVDGLNALWTPNFAALKDPQVWIRAFAQVFYSLSVAFGIMLTYSSYLRRRSNLVGTGLVAAFANSSFEVLAGFGVFATLGFMAFQQGGSVAELGGLQSVSLSFVAFPAIIAEMPGGALFGILFFLSLTLAGITSLISLVQVAAAGIGEKFALDARKAALAVGIPAAAISLFVFGTTSGVNVLGVVDTYINQIGVVSSAVLMCYIVAFGVRRLPVLQRHLNAISETRAIGAWWRLLVGVIVPTVLAYMFASTFAKLVKSMFDSGNETRVFDVVFGWGSLIVAAAGAAILTMVRWRTPVDDFAPIDLDVYAGPRRSHRDRAARAPRPGSSAAVGSDESTNGGAR